MEIQLDVSFFLCIYLISLLLGQSLKTRVSENWCKLQSKAEPTFPRGLLDHTDQFYVLYLHTTVGKGSSMYYVNMIWGFQISPHLPFVIFSTERNKKLPFSDPRPSFCDYVIQGW